MTPPGGGAPFTEERTGSHAVPGGGLSDDTAILTPQKPAVPGDPGFPRHDNVSGHTVTSGIPVIPPSASFDAPGMGPNAPGPHTPPKLPEPVSPPPASSAKAPKKKGRSKLVLLATGVVLVAGVAYGAGLLMNRSDVPKGTTVLGIEIGGGTRDEAVKKLDGALDGRLDKPLKLSVDGKTFELQPDNAGLQVDIDATVGKAATSDYNPVNVIGSLFGQSRVVEPEIPVDQEKLQAALEDAAGGAGTVKEGSITFESGKAVPVYPQAGKGVDVAKAADVVAAAYRTQVETGTAAAVNVPTTTQQPKVTKAEVDRMMKEFAEPAMSDRVTVQTDPAHSVPMSPEKSLWKFLRVEAVNGKLVEKPDLKALEDLYGQAFDDVLITRGNGEKTPSPRRTSTAPSARRWSARPTVRPSSRRTRADPGGRRGRRRTEPSVRRRSDRRGGGRRQAGMQAAVRAVSVEQGARGQRLPADAVRGRLVDRRDDVRVRLQFGRARRELAALHEELGALVAQAGRAGREEQGDVQRPQADVGALGAGRRPGTDVVQDARDHLQRPRRGQHGRLQRASGGPGDQQLGVRSRQHPAPVERVGQHLPGARPARVAEAHDEVPGSATPYTGAPARRATSIHTTDSRIGSPRRRRSTSCSSEDSSRR